MVTAVHGPKVYTASKHAVVLVEHLADKTYRVSAREILHAAGIPDLIHAADPGSKEKLYEMISGGPPPEVDKRGNVRIPDLSEYVRSRFYAWTELSHQLTKLKSPQFAGATQWLADLYDNFQPPSASKYRDVAKNIRFPFAPRTNILGFSSEDWFFDNLSEVDSAGGFFPRWLLFDARGDRTIAMSKDRDPRVLKSLSKALARLLAIPEGEQVQF